MMCTTFMYCVNQLEKIKNDCRPQLSLLVRIIIGEFDVEFDSDIFLIYSTYAVTTLWITCDQNFRRPRYLQ